MYMKCELLFDTFYSITVLYFFSIIFFFFLGGSVFHDNDNWEWLYMSEVAVF